MGERRVNPLPFILGAEAVGLICFLSAWYFGEQEKRAPYGSRGTEGSTISSEVVREIMRELDPVDSLYFDVSVARRCLEEGDVARAKRWLDSMHALGELHRSVRLNFISPSEGEAISRDINDVVRLIDEGKMSDALRRLIELQDRTGEIAYRAIAERFKAKGLDPPQRIDARFEPIREKKKREWEAKGYRPGLIEKGLLWAEDWAMGIARRFIRDPELAARVAEMIYPEALDLAERYLEAMGK